ncbi:hypothetical protein [Plantibacter sp. CFBP 8775]|uniref:hypothetical protein n=1 Tax=Plantibacter sp. CFBP 8775 TaxID=2774038 RepID=UPI001781D4C0|nr:hypothetical protein [Plantibacter sp. CFBP 8775]MBD8104740.1 hypothetical protein [Plantibacter sp. CFBP 8775]
MSGKRNLKRMATLLALALFVAIVGVLALFGVMPNLTVLLIAAVASVGVAAITSQIIRRSSSPPNNGEPAASAP